MLLLTGLNHHTTPIELREKCYIGAEQLPNLLYHLKQLGGVEESVVISTCNRLEVYSVVHSEAAAESIMRAICAYYDLSYDHIRPHLYVEQDSRVVDHLLRVASGLDSMVLGEAQILGQVRDALNAAASVNVSGTLLHRLFECAVHTGKRAHSETSIGEHTTSVSHAAARLVMERTSPEGANVLIVGTGEMAALAAQALVDRGYARVNFINRTYSRAVELAERIGGEAYEWSELWDCLEEADAVISATGAPHLIFYANDMAHVVEARNGSPFALVDIAVPRDIDPNINTLPGADVFDIDDLQNVVDENIAHRKAAVPAVMCIIAEEYEKYLAWLNERRITPVIRDLRREVRSVVQAELETALNKLGDVDDAQRAVIERMAHRIVNKVLHSPTVSLRSHAANGEAETYARVVRDLFALAVEV